jgi:hypothetical protein
VSFGRVDVDQARGFDLTARPMMDLYHVGSFVQTEHGVQGDVYIRDSQTIVIRNFSYDGRVRIQIHELSISCKSI